MFHVKHLYYNLKIPLNVSRETLLLILTNKLAENEDAKSIGSAPSFFVHKYRHEKFIVSIKHCWCYE
jgi:hypothetical protein